MYTVAEAKTAIISALLMGVGVKGKLLGAGSGTDTFVAGINFARKYPKLTEAFLAETDKDPDTFGVEAFADIAQKYLTLVETDPDGVANDAFAIGDEAMSIVAPNGF